MAEDSTPMTGEEARRSLRWKVDQRLERLESGQRETLAQLKRIEELLNQPVLEEDDEEELDDLLEQNDLRPSPKNSQPSDFSPPGEQPMRSGGQPLELGIPAVPTPQKEEEERQALHEARLEQEANEQRKRPGGPFNLRNWL